MNNYILQIIHLACYLLAMVPCFIMARSIHYEKLLKVRSNGEYLLAFILVGLITSFLLGEFLYQIITLFF